MTIQLIFEQKESGELISYLDLKDTKRSKRETAFLELVQTLKYGLFPPIFFF